MYNIYSLFQLKYKEKIRLLELYLIYSDFIKYFLLFVKSFFYLSFISLIIGLIFIVKIFILNIYTTFSPDVSLNKMYVNIKTFTNKIDNGTSTTEKKLKSINKYSEYDLPLETPQLKKSTFYQKCYTPSISDELLLKAKRAILIDKENNKIFLLYKNPFFRKWLIGRMDGVGFGMVPGQKVSVNDGRSPEGIYFIIDKRDKPLKYLNVYGPKAFVLNYPNHLDKTVGRTGYGIWIHGNELDSGWRPTRGCFSLDNRFIVYLDKFVDLLMPVIVVSSLETSIEVLMDENLLKRELRYAKLDYNFLHKEISPFLTEWAKTWSRRDIEKYMTFYSKNMFIRGMDYSQWKEYKKRIFSINDTIDVKISDITIVEATENEVKVEFLQKYWAKNMDEIGMKRFILVKENGVWKIKDEMVVRKVS